MRQAGRTVALGAWLMWAVTAGTAFAAVEPGHWYGGVAAGLSTTDIAVGDWNDGSLTSGSVDTSGFSYTVFAGYDFNRFLGMEVTYWRMADTQFDGSSASARPSVWIPGRVTGFTQSQGLAIEGTAALPVSQRFKVFAHGGLLFWDTETHYFPTITSQVTIDNNQLTIVNDNGVNPVYGVGAELRFYRNFWLRADWTRSTVGLARSKNYAVDYPSLGLIIHF